MPGKPDSWERPSNASLGTYYPGNKEYRAWDEGWRYRHGGTAIARPITDNPYDANDRPAESKAWNAGWNESNGNTGGEKRMPATSGAPPA